jgi:hypothetical protein
MAVRMPEATQALKSTGLKNEAFDGLTWILHKMQNLLVLTHDL